MWRSGQDPDSPLIASAEYNLARLLVKMGRLDEAHALAGKALASYRKRHGQVHRNVVKVEMLEVERLLDAGALDDASELFSRLVASPAERGDMLLARRHALAVRIAEQGGEYGKALEASRHAWEAIRRAWGEHHPLTLEYGPAYARQLSQGGEHQQARAIVSSVANLAPAFSARSPLHAELARALRQGG